MPFSVYILVMAGITYLIRMLPFTLIRKKIRNPFFRSLMYYIPYAVLAAMTVPAVFASTGNVLTAAVGCTAALILAFLDQPLIVVALAAAAASFIAELII